MLYLFSPQELSSKPSPLKIATAWSSVYMDGRICWGLSNRTDFSSSKMFANSSSNGMFVVDDQSHEEVLQLLYLTGNSMNPPPPSDTVRKQ